MQEDPWFNFEGKYNVGDVVKATVTKITTFGAFIEIEPGIEGLAHISELSDEAGEQPQGDPRCR